MDIEHLEVLRLIERSRDVGDGWKQCSPQTWPHVRHYCQSLKELVEVDEVHRRVRITSQGKLVLKWL